MQTSRLAGSRRRPRAAARRTSFRRTKVRQAKGLVTQNVVLRRMPLQAVVGSPGQALPLLAVGGNQRGVLMIHHTSLCRWLRSSQLSAISLQPERFALLWLQADS